jgi:CheY-like chemotaxis protein
VDDEPALLRLFQHYLTRLGYAVETCSSGREALEFFSADPTKYAVVLADQTMPDMTGHELLEELLRLNPEICIVLCSGYPFDPFGLPAGVQRRVRFLQKPFLPKMLLEAIEELLGERRDASSA